MSERVSQVCSSSLLNFTCCLQKMGAAMGLEHLEFGHIKHKLEEKHGLITALSGALINHPARPPFATLRETIRGWKYKKINAVE